VSHAALRAVLFDAAGTLIRLREPLGDTYARVADAYGVRLPPWRIEDAFHRVFAAAPPMVFPGRNASQSAAAEREWWRDVVRATFLAADGTARFARFDAFFAALWEHFAGAAAWEPTAGAREALHELRGRGFVLGVVSNFDQRLPEILRRLDLLAALDTVVLPAHAGAAKPDSRIFAFALDVLGVTSSESVYVGDDAVHDLEGARSAGLRAIDVASLATLRELSKRLAMDAEPRP
jgi:putative hydrolase of the HAD superfamily